MAPSSTLPAFLDPNSLPTVADVQAAALRLEGKAVRTPLLESPLLNDRVGGRILVKPECLQRTGSFKFRGAYNKLAALDRETLSRGVVAYSSGNHAQGVAAAARMMGVPALIVMPEDAPRIKMRNTRAWGAEILTYDRFGEDRIAIAERVCADRGATLVRPYDDPFIISGQGTIGLEIAEDLARLGATASAVLVPCGGGGLISGTALGLSAELPDTPVYAVEPEGFDDTRRSLESGRHERVAAGARSICDALLSPTPGEITFALNRRLLSGAFAVSDAEALAAIATAFADLKIVAEPGGAVALAAVLQGRLDPAGETVVAVISGGNVDAETFRAALAGA